MAPFRKIDCTQKKTGRIVGPDTAKTWAIDCVIQELESCSIFRGVGTRSEDIGFTDEWALDYGYAFILGVAGGGKPEVQRVHSHGRAERS